MTVSGRTRLRCLLCLPLLFSSTTFAQGDALRSAVSRMLEQKGIIAPSVVVSGNTGNASAAALSTSLVPQANADFADAPPVPSDASARAMTVVGIVVRFTAPEPAERAEGNQAPPENVLQRIEGLPGFSLVYKRPMALGGHVFSLSEPIDHERFRDLEQALLALPEVGSVEPDALAQPRLIPDDDYFYYQWSLLATGDYSDSVKAAVVGMNVTGAWDLVDEEHSITVAVLDTGLTEPPPIARARILPGFDFISSPERARDGDGWDDDPKDEGDFRGSNECTESTDARDSSWHGTKMVSVIAERGDDGVGIAGIDWRASILPVRVLGKCGGVDSDVIDGMLWAAGHPVPGAPVNNNPARIINLSLGSLGDAPCKQMYRQAFAILRSLDVVSVAGVGNDNADAAYFEPSNCLGPVSVGAVDHLGERASYSNWSDQGFVDISAPGGDRSRHGRNGLLVATSDKGDQNPYDEPRIEWTSGTSIAAAHVSGALSLAMRLDPLQHVDLLMALLFTTAQPFGNGSECEREFPRCGIGIVDIEALIQAALVFKDRAVVRDFYHAGLNHYFRSGNWDEVSQLLKGSFGGWEEREDLFLAWRDDSVIGALPVCRFYGTPGIGPNSHFYTVDPDECEFIKQHDPGWTYEGTAFYAKRLNSLGGCPRNTQRLYRYYNQRAHLNDSNHRYTTTLDDREAMEAAGWVMEGVAMCVPH